jgi:hypothetical protein
LVIERTNHGRQPASLDEHYNGYRYTCQAGLANPPASAWSHDVQRVHGANGGAKHFVVHHCRQSYWAPHIAQTQRPALAGAGRAGSESRALPLSYGGVWAP